MGIVACCLAPDLPGESKAPGRNAAAGARDHGPVTGVIGTLSGAGSSQIPKGCMQIFFQLQVRSAMPTCRSLAWAGKN